MEKAKYSYPNLTPPEPTPPPICPICGAETDTFKRDYFGDIVGCDECIKEVDAWDYREEHGL